MKFVRYVLLILVGCCLFTMSCQAVFASSMTVPFPGEFQPAVQNDGTILYTSVKDIEQQFRSYSGQMTPIFYNHNIKRFIVPKADWFLQAVDCYLEFLFAENIRSHKDQWDCDNYSMLLTAYMNLRLWRAGYYDTKLAVGWLKVYAKVPWAGIPVGMHALMFGVSSDGIYIIEPQNGRYVRLSSYPNRENIQEVYLF